MSLMVPHQSRPGAWSLEDRYPCLSRTPPGSRQGIVDHRLSGFLLKERSFCFTKPTLHSGLPGALESRLAARYRPRGTANGLKTHPLQSLAHSGRVHSGRGLPTPGAGGLGPGWGRSICPPPEDTSRAAVPKSDREWSLGLSMRRPGPGGAGWQEPSGAGLPSSRPLCRPRLCGR